MLHNNSSSLCLRACCFHHQLVPRSGNKGYMHSQFFEKVDYKPATLRDCSSSLCRRSPGEYPQVHCTKLLIYLYILTLIFLLYADDTEILNPHKYSVMLIHAIPFRIPWLKKSRIKINEQKCNYMVLSPRRIHVYLKHNRIQDSSLTYI